MNSREILVCLSIKFLGNWNDIYSFLESKKELPEEERKELLSKVKTNYITFTDAEYPESLRRSFKPPFVLFYYGDISLLSDKNNKLAVVGSRKMSEYGQMMTEDLVSKLCKDFVIVSGMAMGVDATAQRTAIANGGKTVAVLGNGPNICYLKDNLDLYEECKKNHLVISEYPYGLQPCPENFPIRNRIIVGLCDTLLVTEGKINSGTQVSAMLMAQKDGNVCCVPTRAKEDSICNELIANGAFLVETAEDIYDITHVVSKKPVFEK